MANKICPRMSRPLMTNQPEFFEVFCRKENCQFWTLAHYNEETGEMTYDCADVVGALSGGVNR